MVTDQIQVQPTLEKIFIRDLLARVVAGGPGGSTGGAAIVLEAGGVADLAAAVEAGADTVFVFVSTPGVLTLNFPSVDATHGRTFVLVLLCDQDPTSYVGTIGGSSTNFAVTNPLVNLTPSARAVYVTVCFPIPDFGAGPGWNMLGIAIPPLGNSAAKDVGTGPGDVAAGDAPANAVSVHVSETDPHGDRTYTDGLISALGDAATKNVGTGSGDVAAGNAVATHVAASDPHGDRGWATGQIFDLRGVSDAVQARVNLGLGGAATKSVGTGSTQVSPGDWPATAVAAHAAAADPHGDRSYAAGLVAALGNAATKNVGTTPGSVAAGDDPRFAGSGIPATLVDAKGDLLVGTANDTAARLAVGTDYLPLRALASETAGVGYGTATIARGAYVDNAYYLLTKANGTQSTTTVTTIANTIVFWLVEVLEPCTVDGLFIYVNTGAASARWRLGLYACSPTTGKPTGNVIVQDGEIDASIGSTYKTDSFTASSVLAPGYYWAALASNSNTTAYRISSATQIDMGSTAATNNNNGSWSTSWTYSSSGLPDVSGLTIVSQNANAPYVRWKVRR